MFYMEAWFRFDPNNLQFDGFIATIFCLEINGECVHGFGAANTFLRLYVDSKIIDIPYLWKLPEKRESWHHVGMAFVKLHE